MHYCSFVIVFSRLFIIVSQTPIFSWRKRFIFNSYIDSQNMRYLNWKYHSLDFTTWPGIAALLCHVQRIIILIFLRHVKCLTRAVLKAVVQLHEEEWSYAYFENEITLHLCQNSACFVGNIFSGKIRREFNMYIVQGIMESDMLQRTWVSVIIMGHVTSRTKLFNNEQSLCNGLQ